MRTNRVIRVIVVPADRWRDDADPAAAIRWAKK
jgi:hypothetical protein